MTFKVTSTFTAVFQPNPYHTAAPGYQSFNSRYLGRTYRIGQGAVLTTNQSGRGSRATYVDPSVLNRWQKGSTNQHRTGRR